MRRLDCLKIFAGLRKEELAICGVGYGGRELYQLGHREINLYNIEMPYPSALALGLALALPEQKILAFDGDGSLLAGLGVLATIANREPPNLVIVVWDNESYLSTGGLPTATAGKTNLEALARGAGIKNCATAFTLEEFEALLTKALAGHELFFLVAKVEKQIPRDLPSFPFNLTENAIIFRRTLIDRGLVSPGRAVASWVVSFDHLIETKNRGGEK